MFKSIIPPPPPPPMEGTFALDHPHCYNFHSRACFLLSYTPHPGIFCYLHVTWLAPPEENIFIKNAVALYFYAHDNYVFCNNMREQIFLFILKQCLMFSVLPCQSCLACRGLSLLTINGMSLTTKEVIPYKDTYDSIYERASIRQLLPFR